MIKKIFTIIFICLISGMSYASETKIKKEKLYNIIIIKNFETASSTDKYKYYAEIIPYTIAKNLSFLKKFEIYSIPTEIKAIQAAGIDRESAEYKDKVNSIINKKIDADFIISGNCNIEKILDEKNKERKILAIDIQIYNVKKKKSINIQKKSEEVAFIKDVLDELSSKIDSLVQIFQTENRKYDEPVRSSYYGFYNAISNISFGMNVGKFFVRGKLKDDYNDGKYIKPYILFNTTGIVGVSLNAEYYTVDSNNSDTAQKEILAGTLGIPLSLRFSNYLRITFEPAFGLSSTKNYYNINGNPMEPDEIRKSKDLYLDSSLFFNMNLEPIQIRFGCAYKRLFVTKPLELYSLFVGAGYNL